MIRRLDQSHVVFRTSGVRTAKEYLNGLVGQILEQTKAGAVRFLFIDEASQAGSFSVFSALRDASPKEIMGNGIATNRESIRSRLAEMLDVISMVKQDKLRQDHLSLDDYNDSIRRHSGATGEPYRYVVIADWPHGFDEDSCRSLMKIMETGAVCGVYVLASWDKDAKAPYPFDRNPAEVWRNAFLIDNTVNTGNRALSPRISATLKVGCGTESLKQIVAKHAEALKAAKGAIYPYQKMREAIFVSQFEPFRGINDFWSGNSSHGLVLPVGLAAGARIESVEIGKSGGSDAHHIIIVGPAGKGKTNLLHVMTQSLADIYSPMEVALYLIDLNGVAFERYARDRLPHARVVAAHGDPLFGVAVLQGVSELMHARLALFQSVGVEQFHEYRSLTKKPLDRIVVIIDEFHKMLVDDTQDVSQQLLRSLGREGRKFGIHLILATQTLKGVDFPSDVLDQIAIRIVLGGSRDDYLSILADDNRAAGSIQELHGLVNADRGRVPGNRIVQIALALDKSTVANEIQRLGQNWRGYSRSIAVPENLEFHLFDGNKPAILTESRAFSNLLSQPPKTRGQLPIELLLGEPLALRETCRFALARDSRNNALLLAGRAAELAGSTIAMLLSVIAQQGPKNVYISIVEALGTESTEKLLHEQFKKLSAGFPDTIALLSRPSDSNILDLLQRLEIRINQPDQSRTQLLLLFGIHKLRVFEDNDDAKDAINGILARGPDAGVHVVVWSNSLNNLRCSRERFGFGATGMVGREEVYELLAQNLPVTSNRLNYFDRFEGEATMVRPFYLMAMQDLDAIVAGMQSENRSVK